jgi:micrococcal nuclease
MMNILVRFLLAFFILVVAGSSPQAAPRTVVKPETFSVVDGDTVALKTRDGRLRVRAVDYDAPGIGRFAACADERALGDKARDRLVELLSPPRVFTIKWSKGRDEYGRRKAWFYSNHTNVRFALISEGLARRWQGKKTSWCFSPSGN